jgi:queuine tRNA-ribosyltransferase
MSATEPANPGFAFHVLDRDPHSQGRNGELRTLHGKFATPAFMPVGTAASVKGVDPGLVAATGSAALLCNTYHLTLRPGDEVVRDLGGLHRFMGWDGTILTDSGGYQVFSLSDLARVDANGVTFRSHIDGKYLQLTPERAMEIQLNLGSDVLLAFDECLPHSASEDEVRRSVETRTLPWEERCLALRPRDGRALFAIGQGGLHEEPRRRCAKALRELPFDGFAIGGLSVGESPEEMARIIACSTELLPEDRPRYLMGVGSPLEIIGAVSLGVDMFDCVLPTRNARNATAFTFDGPLRLRNARHLRDPAPIESGCPCETCVRGFSRAYLRHLIMAKEILGATLMSLHNLTFMQRLMCGIRGAIRSGTLAAYRARLAAGWSRPAAD